VDHSKALQEAPHENPLTSEYVPIHHSLYAFTDLTVHIPSSSTAADSNSVQVEPHVIEVAVDSGGEAESMRDSTGLISTHPEAAVDVSSRLPPKKLPKSQTAAPYGAASKVVTVQSIISHPTTHLINETQVSQYSTELKKYVTPTPFAIKQSLM
jgi:hypothetical protein